MDRKDIILDALEKMRKKEVADKQPFKARAYAIVVKQIKNIEGPITKMEDLVGVTGIGDKIKTKLEEIFATGKLQQVERYDDNGDYQIIDQLLQIHAIGPAKARQLVQEHAVKSVDDLKTRQHLLNDKQKMGLKYYDEFLLRIPRSEMMKHDNYIKDMIKRVDKDYVVEITGSYRRGEKDSGDIDVLITHPDESIDHEQVFKNIINLFVQDGYVTDIFAQGNKKCLAVCKAKRHRHFRRIDFMITGKHEFPFALLYFTGSGPFNIDMRNLALERGYSLSEYGLKHAIGTAKGDFASRKFASEQEIFTFLGLEYVPPKDRKANVLKCFTTGTV
jgi:DNA polymerase/3'-5' exonuclease PolX